MPARAPARGPAARGAGRGRRRGAGRTSSFTHPRPPRPSDPHRLRGCRRRGFSVAGLRGLPSPARGCPLAAALGRGKGQPPSPLSLAGDRSQRVRRGKFLPLPPSSPRSLLPFSAPCRHGISCQPGKAVPHPVPPHAAGASRCRHRGCPASRW